MRGRSKFTEKNTMLVREFDKYIVEHPAFAEQIPNSALIIMQIEGDEEFNEWARQAARKAADKSNPRVYVTVTEMKPVRSRIGKLKVELAA